MKQWNFAAIFIILNILAAAVSMEGMKTGNLPRIQDATLLTGYPPYDLVLTTGDKTSTLQSDGGDWYVTPTISAKAQMIASARMPANASRDLRTRPPLIVSTYSISENKWTSYNDLDVFDGTVAISPDGTKLACITRKKAGGISQLRILNLRTGQITASSESGMNASFEITWSPDGKQLAFQRDLPNPKTGLLQPLRAIYILNMETGNVLKLVDGISPSWSPSGEWIAFYGARTDRGNAKQGLHDKDIDSLNLIRPDGTDSKTVLTFRKPVSRVAPVWSPDSGTVLINTWRDEDKATMDIYQLNLATLKFERKFKNTPPVFAWVASH